MRPVTNIVKNVRMTEKGARLAESDQYLVDVAKDANKIEIRNAVEKLFEVKVKKVNTISQHGKWRRLGARTGRKPDWKKAVVTVEKGQKIEVKE